VGLATAFTLPEGAPDFVCPHGKAWGFVPEGKATVQVRPVPSYVAERRAACDACTGDGLDCSVRYRRMLQETRGVECWFRKYIAAQESTCPMGYWTKQLKEN